MKIVFAASEAAPYIKTGGLGDVMKALPAALSSKPGNEIILFLPYYGRIKSNPEIKTKFITSFAVDLAWRKQHVGVFALVSRKRKLKVYFIDNEYYFCRANIYGEPDDGERFAYFSKAILETMQKLDMRPDIIHCNDWQTALVPVFLHAFYHDSLGGAKTVFTIHNIEYQGKADRFFIPDTLGLPAEYTDALVFDGCVNFMKAAILKSDCVTTVSKTYAEEIKYPYFAHGLSGILCEHDFKLCGITNGIDDSVSPLTDPAIAANYDKENAASGKKENKKKLQAELGLRQDEKVPLIGMVTRIVGHKGMDLICCVIDELMRWDIQIVILGTGDKKYEDILACHAAANPDKFALRLDFDSALASRIYAGSDMYLMPSKSEPCGLSQLIAMRFGTVPIVNATGGLKDTVSPFNPETGLGEGFTFQSFNAGDLLDAIRRALTLYHTDEKSWKRLVDNDMDHDSSWDKPADEYTALYKKAIG